MQPPDIASINNLLIVGNGFDLDLGLKTGYGDFLNSEEFLSLTDRKPKPNELAKHLVMIQKDKNWVDIEQEFAIYSNKFGNSTRDKYHATVKSNYRELKRALTEYIRTIDVKSINQGSRAYQLICSLVEQGSLSVIDFNYTDTIQTILDHKNIPYRYIQIHGNAKSNDVVFGVQDNVKLHAKHKFFLKSTSLSLFTDWLVGEAINSTQGKVSLFGHSLGASDHTQFLPFFSGNRLTPISVDLHYHSEESLDSIWEQIDTLTTGKIMEFRGFHNLKMIGPES